MSRKLLTLAALLALAPLHIVTAQDLAAPIAGPPSGSVGQAAFAGDGLVEAFAALRYGLTTSLAYDSNVRSSSATGGNGEGKGDVILTVSPMIGYGDPGGDFTYAGSFTLNDSVYFSDSDLGGLGYNAAAKAAYKGGRFLLAGTFSSSLSQGRNSNYDNYYVETLNFQTGLSFRYKVGPKTFIDSRFAYSWTEPSEAIFANTYYTNLNVAAMWRATPLTSIGPGLAWTLTGRDNQPDRQTIDPTVNVTYKLSKRMTANGTFGIQAVQRGGGQDSTFTANLGVKYRRSSLWDMNLAIYKGQTANGGLDGGFQDTTSVRLGYHRKIRRAQLTLGTRYQISDYSGGSLSGIDPLNYFSFDSALTMPVLYRRANASLFYNWRHASGGTNAEGLAGFTLGLSLSSEF